MRYRKIRWDDAPSKTEFLRTSKERRTLLAKAKPRMITRLFMPGLVPRRMALYVRPRKAKPATRRKRRAAKRGRRRSS